MNQSLISHTDGKTEVGYMPMLNARADSYDTLNTKFQHEIHIVNQLDSNFTISVVDKSIVF